MARTVPVEKTELVELVFPAIDRPEVLLLKSVDEVEALLLGSIGIVKVERAVPEEIRLPEVPFE